MNISDPLLALRLLGLFLALFFLGSLAKADSKSDIVAVVLGESIQKDSKTKPDVRIFSPLLARFAKDNSIHPTEDEIDSFISKTEERQKRLLVEQEREVARISRELENSSILQEQRDKLASQKKAIEKILNMQHEMADRMKGKEDEVKMMKRKMGENFVQRWKINKALYDKYGGRVIFQQAGAEPLDAYRDFLREESQKGSFQIFDPKVEEDFWRYFTDDKMHIFLPEDDAKKAFASPWWMTIQGTSD